MVLNRAPRILSATLFFSPAALPNLHPGHEAAINPQAGTPATRGSRINRCMHADD